MGPCPSADDVQRLLNEPTGAPEGELFTRHLEDCPRCRALLDARTDLPGLRGPTTLPEVLSPTWAALLERMKASPPGAASPAPPGSALPVVPGYEILGELGRGGMGIVYQARQVRLRRLVALKMVLKGAFAEADALQRFRQEAEAIARLKHPHIVEIHEVGDHDGLPYFCLEFLEGGSLAAQLGGAPQPPRAAAELTETLARAVHHAHGQGILHRDLKPANVLLTADRRPKVTDFGLAKRLDASSIQTESGALVGTPAYMAPEQALGQSLELGPPTDVHALGAILYEMLTGRPPFQGENLFDTLQQVIGHEPVPPSRLQPKVPGDLETICLKCLAKAPGRRYASAEALAEELRRFLDGRPIHARPVGRPERLVKWAGRHPALTAVAVLAPLALALLVGVGVALWYNTELQQANEHLDAARQEAEKQKRAADAARQEADRLRKDAEEKLPLAVKASAQPKTKQAVSDLTEMYQRIDAWKNLNLPPSRRVPPAETSPAARPLPRR